jgi:hypothetical protein
VDADLDTLVTALYVEIDDLIPRPSGRGRRPRLSSAELICLAVMQVLLRYPSERHWLRYARKHLRGMFPYLPDQDGYNKRMRTAGPLLAQVMRHLATRTPSWWDQLRLIDSTPLPCAASRETVRRSDLAGDAGYGYCAASADGGWSCHRGLERQDQPYAHPAVTTSGHLPKAATRRPSVKRRSGRRERAWLLWAGTARRWPASLDVSTTVTR